MYLILIILICFILVFLLQIKQRYSDFTLSWIIGVSLMLLLIAIPISIRIIERNILKVEMLQNTLNIYRANDKNLMEFEKATITQSVIEYNEWIISMKYQKAHNWVNWYIPQEINNTNLVK